MAARKKVKDMRVGSRSHVASMLNDALTKIAAQRRTIDLYRAAERTRVEERFERIPGQVHEVPLPASRLLRSIYIWEEQSGPVAVAAVRPGDRLFVVRRETGVVTGTESTIRCANPAHAEGCRVLPDAHLADDPRRFADREA